MKSIDLLRRRLADLLPGQREEINQTRQTANLLEIAVEALEFRSDTLFSTGSELGQKIGGELNRQKLALKGKANQKRDVDAQLTSQFDKAYQGFLVHERVQKSDSPEREARRLAWESTHQKCVEIVGRPMKLASLKKRLRPYL